MSWGDGLSGGNGPNSVLANIGTIYSNYCAFAAVDTTNKLVFTWGGASCGGSVPDSTRNVVQIFSTKEAFAAILQDRTVISWGSATGGGQSPSTLTNIVTVTANAAAFCALKRDTTVVCWGNAETGASASSWNMLHQVSSMVGSWGSFAFIMNDGSVTTTGEAAAQVGPPDASTKVSFVSSTHSAFSAVLQDGVTIIAWGASGSGGNVPTGTAVQLENTVATVYGSTTYEGRSTDSDKYIVTATHTFAPTLVPGTTGVPTFAPSVPPVVCPAGSYYKVDATSGPQESCQYCPAGSFNPYTGTTSCWMCTAGTSSREVGAVSSSCTRCVTGTFADISVSQCEICKHSTPIAKSCMDCPAGFYSLSGQACKMCPNGTYSEAGASSCGACAKESFASLGSSQCTQCT